MTSETAGPRTPAGQAWEAHPIERHVFDNSGTDWRAGYQAATEQCVLIHRPFTLWRGVCGHVWDRAEDDTPDCPRCEAVTLALTELRERTRKLGHWTPEEWQEHRGGDPIARTINAVEDIIDSMVDGSVREADVGSQLADPSAALIDKAVPR